MTRTTARRLAVQLSFAENGGSDLDIDGFFAEEYYRTLPAEDGIFSEQPREKQLAYIRALVEGVASHRAELDAAVAKHSRGWKPSRISRTALTVLRCCLYELMYMPDIPVAASINDAVELAKSFDEPETVSFINGVLGGFVREREAAGIISAETADEALQELEQTDAEDPAGSSAGESAPDAEES